MSVIVGEVVSVITADTNGFSIGIRNIQRQGEQFISGFSRRLNDISPAMGRVVTSVGNGFSAVGGTIESVGNSVKGFGQDITKYITLPIAGAGVAVFNLGKDFETELSKVTGLVGVAKDQVDDWGKDILEMAPRLGKAPKELAEGLFFVTSAGLRGAEAMDVLESSGKASAAGLGETATIADLVTSAMNAYGSENLGAAKATDILVAAVREGKAEASELAGSMGQVLPLAAEMGVTFDQVAAAQAAMTRTGTGADEAATQLKAIMSGLLKPAKQAEDALNAMGTSSANLRKQIKEEGLMATLSGLRELTNKYGEDAMAKVYPNIRGLMGVLDLMGSSAETNAEIFDRVRDSTGMLDEAFKSTSDTLDFKWNQSLATLQTTALGFFDIIKSVMIPVLEGLNFVLGFVSDKFSGLSEPVQKAIVAVAGIAAILGPVITVVGGLIAGLGVGIAAVGTAITTIGTVITAVGVPALAALTLVIPVLIGWITLIVGAIAAWIASFVYLWKTNDEFRENVINTWNVVKDNAIVIFNEIKEMISLVVKAITKLWKQHGDQITNTTKIVWDLVLTFVRAAAEQFKNVIKLLSAVFRGDWSAMWVAIKNIVRTGTEFAKSFIRGMKDAIVNILKSLNGLAGSAMRAVFERMKSIFQQISKLGSTYVKILIESFKMSVFYNTGQKIVKQIISGLKSMIGSLSSAASNMVATIRNKLPFSPAKEGPLKDLNKLNFAGSINESLKKAKRQVKMPTIELGQEIMQNLLDRRSLNIGTNDRGNISINGPVSINGVNDLYSLMEEIKQITRRFTGIG